MLSVRTWPIRWRGNALGVDIAAVMTSSAATGVLGFVFWTVAARGYSTAEVGRASAIISSATLIAILATLSLGSLYERFLPVSGSASRRYIQQGGQVVLAAAALFGVLFVVLGPRERLFTGPVEVALFPVFVAVLAIFAIQDQILVGLGKARTIAVKNIGQSTAKLILVGAFIPLATGSAIVWAWVLPAAVVAMAIATAVIYPATRSLTRTPNLPSRREMWQFFGSSYAISSVGIVVPLLVPLIIVSTLGTEMNAYFSVCWLIINTIGVLIGATAAPFVATASTPGADLRACTIRFAVMCGGAAIAGCLALLALAPLLLGIMGREYAQHGTDLIRIMALTLPSLALITIYTALSRLRRKLRLAVAVQLLLGVLVVTGVSLATPRWGIDAVGYTYLGAELLCTAIIAIPTVVLLRRALQPPEAPTTTSEPVPAPRRDPDIDAESVPARLADVVRERGEHIAIRSPHRVLTYRQLAVEVDLWTRVLGGRDRRAGSVALLADLSPAATAAALATFSTGRPLVPLDPTLPADRSTAMLELLAAHGLSVTDVVAAPGTRTPDPSDGYLRWALDRPAAPESDPAPEPEPPLHPQSLSSIQFTSGSTGIPKAVLHAHGTWLCDAVLMRERFGITTGRRVAVCMPISFAAGLNVLVGSLLSGAEIVAVDPRSEPVESVLDRIADVDVIACTPSYLQALVDAAGARQLPRVARVVTTGEPLHGGLAQRAQRLTPGAVVTNWAGSSETLGIAHYDIAPGAPVPSGVLPAGVPTPHKRIDLAADGRVTVTSEYLALGYLEPAAADTAFLENPDGTRTFVTGDHGRFDDDGNLVLAGRMDAAIKIRGYLVEPAEVESALLDHPAIREAVVTADTRATTPTLTAYVAPAADVRTPSVADVRAALHRRLPSWMVPAQVVILPTLPRNERGKVDRAALPEPVRPPSEPARPGLEAELAALWARVLCLDEVGRTESFYALGGDSLDLQRMLVAVTRRYGVTLSHADFAVAPTLAAFAELLTAHRAGTSRPAGPALAPTTVSLRPPTAATTTTLFCFAGAGASALTFMPLADRLPADIAMYAFQPHGLENRGIPDWTVARAARRHLTDLLRLQPHGPYTLIGHSLGGFIALEVAHLLRELGHEVNLVAMLDSFLPPLAMRAARRRLSTATLTLDAPPVQRTELWRRRLWLPVAGLLPLAPETQAYALREVGVRVGLLHRPRPYPGRVLLVLSNLNRDDLRLWPEVLTGATHIERVDCDHDSVVREPHAARVAELIVAHLNGTAAGQPADSGVSTAMSPTTP
ncbi:alpha/beta fold hydrolase [Mycolicibacterium thermoresistibile]